MPPRMPLIDALKGISAQVIVLHHLASYGPVAEAMNLLLPALTDWLYGYGRMAVQVFLVVAGFLAARGLAPNGVATFVSPADLIWKRYLRLVRPFMVAMLLAIAAAALARAWMLGDMPPDAPSVWQFVAHGLLLHGLLGVPSLSAGVWYVAIDFQLYALLLGLLWLSSCANGHDRKRHLGMVLVAAFGIAALLHWSRNEALDMWAIYFFGPYALGAMSYWVSVPERRPGCLVLLVLVGALALWVDFRLRVVLALLTTLFLGAATMAGRLERGPESRLIAYLGKISYSVFLVHFPVLLIINACFTHFTSGSAALGLVAALLAWIASILAGGIFYRYVESRKQWWPAPSSPEKR
ncbi:MAG: acyltransferase [Betaproteobacteria bacterium]|nr:acyltransferase [Betaproteobacteria bacterium]